MSQSIRPAWLIAVLCAALVASCGTRGGSDNDDGGILPRLGSGGGSNSAPADIGVNSFLWRASLDTIDFMPLSLADPFGGVIVTDWYATPDNPNERFKATVYILDTRLRADGVNVSLFRQTYDEDRGWQDAPVDPGSEVQIENAILNRARELRIATGR